MSETPLNFFLSSSSFVLNLVSWKYKYTALFQLCNGMLTFIRCLVYQRKKYFYVSACTADIEIRPKLMRVSFFFNVFLWAWSLILYKTKELLSRVVSYSRCVFKATRLRCTSDLGQIESRWSTDILLKCCRGFHRFAKLSLDKPCQMVDWWQYRSFLKAIKMWT